MGRDYRGEHPMNVVRCVLQSKGEKRRTGAGKGSAAENGANP
jgi:hypothetical protein